ncbi:MAG: 7-carboxy-7-deazaguanine synthase QueE [Bryobacteraceae bacterium]
MDRESTLMKYPVVEKFFAPQGEGLYTGTPMAFIRLVGCSVGHSVCHACDTDFDRLMPTMGGGLFTAVELAAWALHAGYKHACLTGGEPLDRDLRPLLLELGSAGVLAHIETSGTVVPWWLNAPEALEQRLAKHFVKLGSARHLVAFENDPDRVVQGLCERFGWHDMAFWLTVSPKPGYKVKQLEIADEVKVVLHGLGPGPGWPTLDHALEWARAGKLVFVQPSNYKYAVDTDALQAALEVVSAYPGLRLSVQMHKILKSR